MKSQCDKIIEEQATVCGDRSARLAVESREHKKARDRLSEVLDEVTAKAKAG